MPLYKKLNKNNIRPKLRFEGFNNSWNWVSGNFVFESISNKKHNSDLPILAITQDFGAVPREMIDFNISVTNQSLATYKIVEKGDFIISLRSFQGGIELSCYTGICSPAYIVLKAKKDINSVYFKYYLKTKNYIKNLTQNLEGIRDGKMISYKYFSEVGLIFPSVKEQQKIANFLTSVDSRIHTLEKKKILLEQYKKGVLQKIFKKELRFKDDDGNAFADWEKRRFSDVLFEHKLKSTGKEEVHSVSVHKGVINQIEHLGRSFSAKNTNHYSRALPNDIIYTKSPTGNFPLGIIKQNHIKMNVIISPLYGVFTPETKELGYILHVYFESPINTSNYLSSIIQKGAKNTINITNNTFLSKKMLLPVSKKEQTKIANFLSAIDKNIELVTTKIEHTKTFKKGLLQQMFV